jgi:Mrp family chromosome partitioning ATPase
MGRLLDVLKKAENLSVPAVEQPLRPTAEPSIPPVEVPEPEIEVPFIEVGPHKSLEASPCVLACGPTAYRPPLMPEAPTREKDGSQTVQQPRTTSPQVHFRALPAPQVRGASPSPIAPELVAFHAPEQSGGRQFRELLADILTASGLQDGEGPAALLFSPVRPELDATTTVLNLAITAATQWRRPVIAVDAHLRRPPREATAAGLLGVAGVPGLSDVLAGAATLDQILLPTDQPHLYLLPAGTQTGHSPAPRGITPRADKGGGKRFVAETMRSLLRQLRQRFALVFVNGPYWDGRQETISLGAACDGVYLVVPEQEAETPQIDALVQSIPTQGSRLVGCVLVAD